MIIYDGSDKRIDTSRTSLANSYDLELISLANDPLRDCESYKFWVRREQENSRQFDVCDANQAHRTRSLYCANSDRFPENIERDLKREEMGAATLGEIGRLFIKSAYAKNTLFSYDGLEEAHKFFLRRLSEAPNSPVVVAGEMYFRAKNEHLEWRDEDIKALKAHALNNNSNVVTMLSKWFAAEGELKIAKQILKSVVLYPRSRSDYYPCRNLSLLCLLDGEHQDGYQFSKLAHRKTNSGIDRAHMGLQCYHLGFLNQAENQLHQALVVNDKLPLVRVLYPLLKMVNGKLLEERDVPRRGKLSSSIAAICRIYMGREVEDLPELHENFKYKRSDNVLQAWMRLYQLQDKGPDSDDGVNDFISRIDDYEGLLEEDRSRLRRFVRSNDTVLPEQLAHIALWAVQREHLSDFLQLRLEDLDSLPFPS